MERMSIITSHHTLKEDLFSLQVRQIMKKWADLKCDGKRRIVALRGPNGSNMRKKNLGPVERMVHKILMMSPQGGEEKRVNTVVKSSFLIMHIVLLT